MLANSTKLLPTPGAECYRGSKPTVERRNQRGRETCAPPGQSVPVKAAFWVKDGDGGRWYLYIASDQFENQSLGAGYGEVLRLAAEIESPYLEPSQVKLIPASDPLAQATLDIHRRYPSRMATRLGANNFGGSGVDAVFIYPASVATLTS